MNESYQHFFARRSAAERYLRGRPRFHSFVIDKIRHAREIATPLSSALDVGCGTGFSTLALDTLSEKTIGIDISFEMLRLAEKTARLDYVLASAENLPFRSAEFDLITISQAIHWVDRSKFFAEAGRVLKAGSMIIAYDNYFQGQMSGNAAFREWYETEFLKNYPVPPRAERSFAAASENPADFVLVREESHENALEFSAVELVDYLVTISNVIARVENGAQPIEEVYEWLISSIEPFFDETRKKFAFINPIWYLRRNSEIL